VESIQLLTFTFIGFWLLRSKLAGERCIALDTDWFYRCGAGIAQALVVVPVNMFFETCGWVRTILVERVVPLFANPYHWLKLNRGSRSLFDPDTERPYLGIIIVYVLATFVLLSAVAVII
jgi:multicomponent Na+:H+ antiporter subunit D